MSAKIEQIVEIIEEVREKFQHQNEKESIWRIRVNAIASVAGRREITKQDSR